MYIQLSQPSTHSPTQTASPGCPILALIKVSVEILMARGLDMEEYLMEYPLGPALPSTDLLRQDLAINILNTSYDGHDIGYSLGFMARCFGARAPLCKIANQLLHECLRGSNIGGNTRIVTFRDIPAIENAIDTVLLDWWLADSSFQDLYEEHCDWARWEREFLEDRWLEAATSGFMNKLEIAEFQTKCRLEQAELDAEVEYAAVNLGL
ncbi:hypothetical protein BDV95DRAFT_210678 [Massariosphaeria phaeospora]|uniref:Uncharacterized protein n=1 Tax=Massariosphaeria phaeospora TaxID=100035 RepID=A0A7C8M2V2_9PLEO|nr:hypothetical protein BDV95DRAFT_210678 [Massariosphaeria phaeospora]